jgi:hypothetical protein
VVFNAYSTDHGHGARSYHGVADLFGIYFPPSDQVFLTPVESVARKGRLRFEPTRNNQQKGIRLAADFEISAWTDERLAGLVGAARALAA